MPDTFQCRVATLLQDAPAIPVDPTPKPRIALLVDGENFPPEHAGTAILRAAKHGQVVVKCVVGDMSRMLAWSSAPGFRAIHAGSGKNAADIRLVIEAMDVIHSQRADVLVIAASDGDYCHLALHLVERGIRVYGIGEAKAPDKLRKACTKFDVVGPSTLTREVSEPDRPVAIPVPSATIAPAAFAPAKPKAKVSEIKAAVRTIIREQGKDGAFPINKLNAAVRSTCDFSIAATDDKTWRGYLTKRPQLFICDPKGPNAMVRLVSP